MSILEYSVAKKIYETLLSVSPTPNDTQIISKEVSIDFTDINAGKSFEIDLGEIPEKSVLLHSQIDVTIPFSDGSISPMFSLGLTTQEETEINFPVTYDFRELIYDQLQLNTIGLIDPQGELSSIDTTKTLNNYVNNLNGLFQIMGVWNVGGSLILGRDYTAVCGTHNSGLCFGGYYTSYRTETEEYNGSSWSSGGALSSARRMYGGCGLQDAALAVGGQGGGASILSSSEEYNGTSWSAGGALNTAIYSHDAVGTQTAALSSAGYDSTGVTSAIEEYNGSSWSIGNNLISGRYFHGSCGVQTACAAFAGTTGGPSGELTTTEEYNGSTWATANNLNSAISYGSGSGTSINAGFYTGGSDSSGADVSSTEEYDGTNWSISGDLNSPVYANAAGGTTSAGFNAGGYNTTTTYVAITEEYTSANLSDLTQGSLKLYVTYTHV